MYSVGDIIVYGTQGICKISEQCTREFNKKKQEYFLLRPIFDMRSVIYVPIDNEELTSQMRDILSKDEIDSIIKDFHKRKTVWIDNDNERLEYCNDVMKSGDRGALMSLVDMLYSRSEELRGQKKHFHIADERNLKRAEKLLHEEFAYVLGISPDCVPEYISSRLYNLFV